MTSLPPSSARSWGLIQVAVAGVLWGTGGLVVQLIRREEPFSPLVLSAERMLIGAAALVLIVVATRGVGEVVRLLRDDPVAAILTGVGTGIYQAFYFVAVTHAGVAVATVVSLGLAPVLLTVSEAVSARVIPGMGRIAVLAAALIGLVLVALGHGGQAGPQPVLGVSLAVASGITYAATTWIGRRVAVGAAPLALTTVATVAGAVLLAPLLVVVDGPVLPNSAAVWGWLIYLGVGTMAASYLLLYAGLRTVSASSAVIASLLEPVTAAVAAWVVLGEHLGAAAVVGTAFVLAAVVGLGRAAGPEVE